MFILLVKVVYLVLLTGTGTLYVYRGFNPKVENIGRKSNLKFEILPVQLIESEEFEAKIRLSRLCCVQKHLDGFDEKK